MQAAYATAMLYTGISIRRSAIMSGARMGQ